MHVPSYPRIVAWLLMLASFAGVAQAVEFDEKIKAPHGQGRCRAENAGRELFRKLRAPAHCLTGGNGHKQGAHLKSVSISNGNSHARWKTSGRWKICRRSVS